MDWTPTIVSIIVLTIAAIIDSKTMKIPKFITYPYFLGGLIYRIYLTDQLGYHLLILPFFFLLLYRNFFAPGDIKLLMGFSLWNSFATIIWFFLFVFTLMLITVLVDKTKLRRRVPASPYFLTAYVLVYLLYYAFPVTSLIYS